MMLMQYLFLISFIKASGVGTHLNCLDLSRNSNEYLQHMLYKEVDKSKQAVI